jgi:hypothetical protein
MAQDDGEVRHPVQSPGTRVPVPVGKRLGGAQGQCPSSLRSWAS